MKTSVKDLKVGDKFVVVKEWSNKESGRQNIEGKMDNYLGRVLTVQKKHHDICIIAKESHVWSWYNEMIDWKSTNKLYDKGGEMTKQFTKADLEDGYKAVYRNGQKRFFSKRLRWLYNDCGVWCESIDNYYNDLKYKKTESRDIMQVYDRQDNLIWERIEKSPIEIRKEEIRGQIKQLLEELSKL